MPGLTRGIRQGAHGPCLPRLGAAAPSHVLELHLRATTSHRHCGGPAPLGVTPAARTRGTAGPGNNDGDTVIGSRAGKADQPVRCAVRRNDPSLETDIKRFQNMRCLLHGVPV